MHWRKPVALRVLLRTRACQSKVNRPVILETFPSANGGDGGVPLMLIAPAFANPELLGETRSIELECL